MSFLPDNEELKKSGHNVLLSGYSVPFGSNKNSNNEFGTISTKTPREQLRQRILNNNPVEYIGLYKEYIKCVTDLQISPVEKPYNMTGDTVQCTSYDDISSLSLSEYISTKMKAYMKYQHDLKDHFNELSCLEASIFLTDEQAKLIEDRRMAIKNNSTNMNFYEKIYESRYVI